MKKNTADERKHRTGILFISRTIFIDSFKKHGYPYKSVAIPIYLDRATLHLEPFIFLSTCRRGKKTERTDGRRL